MLQRGMAGLALASVISALAAGAAAAAPHRASHAAQAPDAFSLEGLWTNASYTRLQRPKSLKSGPLTPQEIAAYEATLKKYHGVPDGGADDVVGQNDSEFPDSGEGLARIHGQIRTSWIVDPADGRLPYTAEARQRLHIGDKDAPENFDGPEGRPQSERCITSNGSSPPMLSFQDANLVEIVQTHDHLAVLAEKNHEVRIIPFDGRRDPHAPPTWAGNPVAHWEGHTLVIETEGFRDPLVDRDFFYHSGAAKVVERFTRTSPDEILYEFTVTDPATFSQPWRAEMLFTKAKGPLFEYACHEGNYAMASILAAARQGHQDPPPATATAAMPAPKPAGTP